MLPQLSNPSFFYKERSCKTEYLISENVEVYLYPVHWARLVQLRYQCTVFVACVFRVSIQKDTKVPNAAIFTVNKEDHTLGNLLMQ